RMANEGELGPKGSARGDLFVEMIVEADEIFERDGTDLYAQVYVPFPTAVLGGEIEVPLIEGTKVVKVPAGMKAPYRTQLRGEGVKDLRRNRRGDLIVEMHIETPAKISAEAKQLIESLKQELS